MQKPWLKQQTLCPVAVDVDKKETAPTHGAVSAITALSMDQSIVGAPGWQDGG